MLKVTPELFITEPAKQLPVAGCADVIVAGGGPAGCAAAVAAARRGASVILLESSSMPGGIMTSGLMANVIDAEGKGGFLAELTGYLRNTGAAGNYDSFDPETVKHYLEKALAAAGVRVRFNTLVVHAICDAGRIQAVVTESPSGREVFIGGIYTQLG